ncbi:hypothetical protein AV530_014625 [Patagioenas fasciata monilis]|uniref:Vesicle-fusing ATPase n=1 Tax=Patagioenas fasciata monilis TaxID=372326 RepID=A0A1V4JZN3_PATFA|nr:hypothetical protein AV530_014625 [Patagioenas fasciata monilis]
MPFVLSPRHVVVKTSPNHKYIFTLRTHPSVVPGSIAFSLPQRKWAGLSIGQEIDGKSDGSTVMAWL